ncbi:MAG: rod shape-determining protein MreC [Mycoplasmatales bacterium]
MNKRLVRNLIILIVILVIANIAIFSGIGKNTVYKISEVISGITSFVTDSVENIKDNNKNKEELASENAMIKSNMIISEKKIEDQNAEITNLITENENLKASILGNAELTRDLSFYNNGRTNYSMVDAQIIIRNINDWNNKATINVGANEGLKAGNVVVYNGKYFGIVEEVLEDYATIKLSTSENIMLNIPSMANMQNKEYNGLIKSYDSKTNIFKFESFTPEQELTIGNKIYTNGYQQGVPKGILIGTILKVNKNDNSMKITYEVKPFEDLYNARQVQVIINE